MSLLNTRLCRGFGGADLVGEVFCGDEGIEDDFDDHDKNTNGPTVLLRHKTGSSVCLNESSHVAGPPLR
jgi:hypothetical protein